MKGIIWLASYPKSGNTWLRVFLTNLKRNDDQPADINELERTPSAACRATFSTYAGIEASNLTEREIERLRPRVYQHMVEQSNDILYCKIHDAYTQTNEGRPLISSRATLGAIYLIRNPLDVAVSYAHHNGTNIDRAIEMMADESHALCHSSGRLHQQLCQRLMSWSKHVLSWVDATGFDVYVMRYEDMHKDALATFSNAARLARLPHDSKQVERAIAFSSFKVLQDMEIEHGFYEKSGDAEMFFRHGKVATWRNVLTETQVEKILQDHGPIMRRFGYLSKTGEIYDYPVAGDQFRKQAIPEPTESAAGRRKINRHTVVLRSKKVIFAEIDGEMALMNTSVGKYVGLDAVGSCIWKLIEQPVTISDLCTTLRSQFDVSPVQCEGDVLSFVRKLSEHSLVHTVAMNG
jgi:hypothetical protein